MMRVYGYILLGLFALISFSCANREEFPGEKSEKSFFTVSRAEGDLESDAPATYRIITYNTTYDFDNPNTGTYAAEPGDILIPRVLDNLGYIVDDENIDHETAMLDNVSGDRYVLCVSPGVINNNDGSFDFQPSKPESTFFATMATKLKLGHPQLYELGILYDRRSRLNFKIVVDPQIASVITGIAVSDFEIYGVGAEDERIQFFPAQRQILKPIGKRKVNFVDVVAEGSSGVELKSETPTYIASGFYAPREVVLDNLKLSSTNPNVKDADYISVSFNISQNGGKPTRMLFVINERIPELLPMHEYTFVFNVKSRLIDLSLDITSYTGLSPHSWYKHNNLDTPAIGEGVGSVNLGSFQIKQWVDLPLNDNPEI